MKRESLILLVSKEFPYVHKLCFAAQWDMKKQPYFCLFIQNGNLTKRVFTL